MSQFIRRSQVREYQNHLKRELEIVFDENVCDEWSSMRDEVHLQVYSPRLDIAVGPFATHERLGYEYDQILRRKKPKAFIEKLIEINKQNQIQDGFVTPLDYEDIIYQNFNARCLIAVEIENNVSRKHLMGGAINASALGRIGILIPWSDEKLRAFVKLFRYLQYLGEAEKNTFKTSNLLIITKAQMEEAFQTVFE